MLRKLLANQWKESRRSPVWTQSLVQNIILGLFALYMMLNLLVLGVFAKPLLEENFPDENVVLKFSGLMVYYLLGDLFIRFFMQSFPTLSIRPYLHLPIQKSKLVNYLLLRSLTSVFNILPILLVVPFFFNAVGVEYSSLSALVWLGLMLTLIFLNNFLAFYMAKSFGGKPIAAILILSLTGLMMYLDYQGTISLSTHFANLVAQIVDQPLLLTLPLLLLGLVYFAVFKLFLGSAYLDDIGKKVSSEASPLELGLARRFGTIGEQIELEVKLIWRNARSRTFLYISILFLLYPLLLMGGGSFDNTPGRLFMGLFLTGAFMLNYGQFLLSWHSSHFDFILTQNISIRDFFMARYYLLASTNLLLFILSLPYLIFYPELRLFIIASFFYNTGVVVYIYMFFCNFNSKRIDSDKGGVFNMEGFGGAHYLIMIPIIAIPIVIWMLFDSFEMPYGGLLTLIILGLLGFVLRDKIIDAVVAQFIDRKHQIAAAFRKK